MNPSAFQIARETATNLGNAFSRVKDENTIEKILKESMSSGNPEVFQNNIAKILSQVSPERQGAAIQYLQNAYANIEKKQQEAKRVNALEKEGINPYFPEALQVEKFKQGAKNQRLENVYGNSQGLPSSNGNNSAPNPAQVNSTQTEATASVDNTNPFSRFTDGQLIGLSGSEDKEISEPAKQELKRRQEERTLQQKKEDNKTAFGEKIAEKVLIAADELAADIPQLESSLKLAEDAIANRNLGSFSWDNIAEFTRIEGLRSKEGAVFKTAMKEFLLGSISRAGARPNQWIEQQIADMAAKIGRSTAANLSVTRAIRNEVDIRKERVRLTQEIADELENSGQSMRKLGSIVSERLSKYASEKQNELYNDLRAIKSIDEKTPQSFHKVKQGTQISDVVGQALLKQFNNDKEKARIEAKKLGYEF